MNRAPVPPYVPTGKPWYKITVHEGKWIVFDKDKNFWCAPPVEVLYEGEGVSECSHWIDARRALDEKWARGDGE